MHACYNSVPSEKLSACCHDAQLALAPVLRHKSLRRIVMTFGNVSEGQIHPDASEGWGGANAAPDGAHCSPAENLTRSSLESWALNPRVVELLSRAKAALEAGAVNERQLEDQLVAQLKVRGSINMLMIPPSDLKSVIKMLSNSMHTVGGGLSVYINTVSKRLSISVFLTLQCIPYLGPE